MFKFVFTALIAVCALFGVEPDLKIKDNEIYVISLLEADVNPALLVPANKADKDFIEEKYQKEIGSPRLQNVVLVKNPKFTLLIDTGLNNTLTKLISELEARGVKPSDITHVAISHAHPDHFGGVGELRPTFENAKLLIAKPEVDYWSKEGDKLTKKRIKLYKNKTEFYDYQKDLISADSGIKAIARPGHTPGMTIFNFNDEFYDIADMIYAFDVQVKRPQISHVYDVNSADAVKSRIKTFDEIKQKNLKVIGTHFPYSKPQALEF